MNQQKNQKKLSVFISHRHKDKAIADVFRTAIEDWSSGDVEVVQSSNAETAFQVGESLSASLRQAIAEANIVLLIYTVSDQDWSWCMYECGLAQDPNSLDTRIVVFQCTEDVPDPLKELICVTRSEESIKALINSFHKDEEFFPRHGKAFKPDISDDLIERRSKELYKNLVNVVPDFRSRAIARWDHFTLALNLDKIKSVRDSKIDFDVALERAKALINKECFIKRFSGDALEHFNFSALADNLKFEELFERWKNQSAFSTLDWKSELCREMTSAMRNSLAEPVSVPFDSIEPGVDAWYLPIVDRVREVPEDRTIEFDVFLFGIRSDVAKSMIRVGSGNGKPKAKVKKNRGR